MGPAVEVAMKTEEVTKGLRMMEARDWHRVQTYHQKYKYTLKEEKQATTHLKRNSFALSLKSNRDHKRTKTQTI